MMGSLDKQRKKVPTALTDRISNSVKEHELLTQLPEMCVPYSVRQIHNGKLTYFNFKLAKEIGLIPIGMEEKITQELEDAILNQFNVRIINEYDRIHHVQYKSEDIKPFKCFATRYLQLQHKNKQGRTSGDGRAVWNGQVTHKGRTWDLNSRGTGVTCMAPGLVEAETPLETGNEDYGYSCGLSELPEIYASSIMSERFHQQGISTERILVAIDNGKGLGICVRAHENLLRPAHIFRYLKLTDHYGAKKLLSLCIDRDYLNGKINFKSDHKNSFEKYLKYFAHNFLNICSQAFHKEIFLWLDWDGDNILIDGGIIDYGSVRRFGVHHNKYKYDDVTRFSTNLDEQVRKGKLTVQVFAQLIDFVLTEDKKPLENFADNSMVQSFDENFQIKLREHFLRDLGLSSSSIKKEMRWRRGRVDEVYSAYTQLQSKKITKELKTLDGVNQWPALNMNVFLSDVPKALKEPGKLKVEKYLADFTEYPSASHDLEQIKKELVNFLNMLNLYQEESGEAFEYHGDFNIRLTTSAVLDLIGQLQEDSTSKIQKSVTDCIEFGFERSPRWVAKAKELYRDDL